MSFKCGFPFKSLIENVYLPYFHEKGEKALEYLCFSGSVAVKSFLSAYRHLSPIEQMPEKEKQELKKYVLELFPTKTPEEKIQACKIIYTIGTIL